MRCKAFLANSKYLKSRIFTIGYVTIGSYWLLSILSLLPVKIDFHSSLKHEHTKLVLCKLIKYDFIIENMLFWIAFEYWYEEESEILSSFLSL